MVIEKCHVCLEMFNREEMYLMSSLIDATDTYTCQVCFGKSDEEQKVGEGISQSQNEKYSVFVNKVEIEVLSTSKEKAFKLAQTMDKFNELVLDAFLKDEEVTIKVALSDRV